MDINIDELTLEETQKITRESIKQLEARILIFSKQFNINSSELVKLTINPTPETKKSDLNKIMTQNQELQNEIHECRKLIASMEKQLNSQAEMFQDKPKNNWNTRFNIKTEKNIIKEEDNVRFDEKYETKQQISIVPQNLPTYKKGTNTDIAELDDFFRTFEKRIKAYGLNINLCWPRLIYMCVETTMSEWIDQMCITSDTWEQLKEILNEYYSNN